MVYESPHKKRPREGEPTPWGGAFDEKEYPRGSIKSIRVENFMTYGNVLVFPGPKLNLVLGPNGSGKSSLVCAVGLGLCGNANRLGRSTQLKEYVRKGCNKASVEIVVSAGPGLDQTDIRIEREIYSDNKSTFKINGRSRQKGEVEKQIADLNIQLDNLCQFLPQEKVIEFSKMSPEELLINTERAIGDASLHDMHTKLIDGGKDLKSKQTDLDNTTRQLDKKRAEMENMKHEVDKIEEHDRLKDEARLLKCRAAQLDDSKKKARLDDRALTYNEEKDKLTALRKVLEKRKKPMQNKENQKMKLKEEFVKLSRQINKQGDEVTQYVESVDDKEIEKKNIESEIQACEEKEDKRKRELQACRVQLEDILDERDHLPMNPEGFDPQEEKTLSDERRSFNARLSEITSTKSDLYHDSQNRDSDRKRLQHQLSQIKAVAAKRIQALDRYVKAGGRFQKFVDHVHHMRDSGKFRGAVLGPTAAEINILPEFPAYAASALESCVPNRAWQAFVVEHSEDQRLIREEAKRMNLSNFASVISFNGSVHASLVRPHGNNDHFAELGTIASLDSVFDCHPLVKHALANEVPLTSSFLVQHEDAVDNIFHNSPIMQLYTPQRCHRKTVSRYNKEGISLSQFNVRKAALLGVGADEQQVAAIEQRLADLQRAEVAAEDQMKATEQEEALIEQRRVEVERRLKTIHSARQQHAAAKRKMETKIKKSEQQIDKLEKYSPLIAKPKLEKELAALGATEFRKLKAFVGKTVPGMLKNLQQRGIVAAQAAQLEDELSLLSASCQNDEAAAKEMEQELVGLKEVMDEAKRAYNTANTTWKRAQDKDMQDGDAEKLLELPEEIEECEALADDRAAEADRLCLGDRGALERYKVLVQDVEQLTKSSESKQVAIQKLQGELEHAKEHWLPQLLEKVQKVSQAFSENFARIGSVGEVALRQADENYEKYAIEIKVKFRDQGSLEVLSPERHSGGEKSVSTIMYLLSLQGITKTPFRVVDEINQGMDQTNERKVFQAMVDASKKKGTAQCLLMTPKLLPQLDYGDCVNVLGIHNAAHMKDVAKRLKPSKQLDILLGEHVNE